jgi:hypothetical protein
MSVLSGTVNNPPYLFGSGGELVSLKVSVDPRFLEDLLEALAEAAFPINPEIDHSGGQETAVSFPAYADKVDEVRNVLARHNFDPQALRVTSMIEEIRH